jgi:hypothetical protein
MPLPYPLPYVNAKVHIYKWREEHREKYNEVSKLVIRRVRAWKKAQVIYLNILID